MQKQLHRFFFAYYPKQLKPQLSLNQGHHGIYQVHSGLANNKEVDSQHSPI